MFAVGLCGVQLVEEQKQIVNELISGFKVVRQNNAVQRLDVFKQFKAFGVASGLGVGQCLEPALEQLKHALQVGDGKRGIRSKDFQEFQETQRGVRLGRLIFGFENALVQKRLPDRFAGIDVQASLFNTSQLVQQFLG